MHAKKKAGPSSTRQLRAGGRSDRAKMDPSVLSSAFSSLSRSDGEGDCPQNQAPGRATQAPTTSKGNAPSAARARG